MILINGIVFIKKLHVNFYNLCKGFIYNVDNKSIFVRFYFLRFEMIKKYKYIE